VHPLRQRRQGRDDLAQAVVEACDEPSNFEFCYPLDATLKEKIEAVATKIYGPATSPTHRGQHQLARYEKNGFGGLPVCIAKTHLSISGDASLKGAADRAHVERPRGSSIRRRRVHLPRSAAT
jgi:formate--tetrahydrofolate ligase